MKLKEVFTKSNLIWLFFLKVQMCFVLAVLFNIIIQYGTLLGWHEKS